MRTSIVKSEMESRRVYQGDEGTGSSGEGLELDHGVQTEELKEIIMIQS